MAVHGSFGIACASAFALCGMRASAAEVAFDAPSECESAKNVRDQVERLIGRPLETVVGADFAVKAVHSGAGGWSATVQVAPHGGAEEPSARTITGRSCAEVTAAAAVSIAMAIEQDREAANPEPTSERRPPSPIATRTAPPTPVRTAKAPVDSASGSKFHAAIALHGLFDAGANSACTAAV